MKMTGTRKPLLKGSYRNISPLIAIQIDTVLRQPVGHIHWAGTETALDSTGFMEGATESIGRAAEEVWADLIKKIGSG